MTPAGWVIPHRPIRTDIKVHELTDVDKRQAQGVVFCLRRWTLNSRGSFEGQVQH
jgi:hypothetical protein